MATFLKTLLRDLPDAQQDQYEFRDSTWFLRQERYRPLPSFEEVRANTPKRKFGERRPIARFEDLGLAVKFGRGTRTSEALCLRAVRQLCPDQVPVPEVYGWKLDRSEVFIYLQLITGKTLEQQWDTMTIEDKTSVCRHLREVTESLQAFKQEPSSICIGISTRSFLGGLSTDRILERQPSPGPWPSVASFHNYLSWIWRRHAPDPFKVSDPWRSLLTDQREIILTHGDLHRSNVIVSSTSPVHVVAVVDWEQSGWYSDYWEYCKAIWTAYADDEWSGTGWIISFLTPRPNEEEAFIFDTRALGT